MYELPTELCGLKIRSDYRAVLDIISALNDPDLSDQEKALITVQILYEDWEKITDLQEAINQAFWFINLGSVSSDNYHPKLMDWEQDFSIIVTSINRVIGQEIRALDYLHWWTFVGAYYEIGDSLFSNIISIRSKKQKGKKLENYEQQFYSENRDLIDLKSHYSKAEQDEIDRLNSLL